MDMYIYIYICIYTPTYVVPSRPPAELDLDYLAGLVAGRYLLRRVRCL